MMLPKELDERGLISHFVETHQLGDSVLPLLFSYSSHRLIEMTGG